MDDNTEVSRQRIPDQVLVALSLLGTQYLIGVIGRALRMDWNHLQQAQVTVACYTLVCALWIYGLYRRQNWLRWVTVVYFALHVVLIPVWLNRIHDAAQVALYWAEMILGAPATVLLCLPKARLWYRSSAIT